MWEDEYDVVVVVDFKVVSWLKKLWIIVDELVIFVLEYVVWLCVYYVKLNLSIVWVEFFW